MNSKTRLLFASLCLQIYSIYWQIKGHSTTVYPKKKKITFDRYDFTVSERNIKKKKKSDQCHSLTHKWRQNLGVNVSFSCQSVERETECEISRGRTPTMAHLVRKPSQLSEQTDYPPCPEQFHISHIELIWAIINFTRDKIMKNTSNSVILVSKDLKGANFIIANSKGQAGGRSRFMFHTHPRTCWDRYHILLCHCRPTLVNLCKGHTHPHTNIQFVLLLLHSLHAHNHNSHGLPNLIYKYKKIHNVPFTSVHSYR